VKTVTKTYKPKKVAKAVQDELADSSCTGDEGQDVSPAWRLGV
jgi:hypothetical protein